MTYEQWMNKIYNPEKDTRVIWTEKEVWMKIPGLEPITLTTEQYGSMLRTVCPIGGCNG